MTDPMGLAVNLIGPLVGVLIGGAIALRTQSAAFRREASLRIRAERREAYLRFVAAARSWQAAVLHPSVSVHGPTQVTGRKYADAGPAFAETIRALTEVQLVGGEHVIAAAWRWDGALRTLSLAIAEPGPGGPNEMRTAVQECRNSEAAFVASAREDVDGAFKSQRR